MPMRETAYPPIRVVRDAILHPTASASSSLARKAIDRLASAATSRARREPKIRGNPELGEGYPHLSFLCGAFE
jgi:hypothetical protein